MSRWSAALFAALLIVGADVAAAQRVPRTGRVRDSLDPGGATVFTETDTAPDFLDYALGRARSPGTPAASSASKVRSGRTSASSRASATSAA